MAGARKGYFIHDFSGGMRSNALRCAKNESESISGMWHQDGALDAMRGATAVEVSTHDTNSLGDYRVRSHHAYTSSDGRTYLVAKRDRTLWLGIPQDEYRRSCSVYPTALDGINSGYFDWELDFRDLKTDATGQYLIRYSRAQPVKARAHNLAFADLWSSKVAQFDGRSSYIELQTGAGYALATTSHAISTWIKVKPSTMAGYQLYAKEEPGPSYKGAVLTVRSSGRIWHYLCEDQAAGKRVWSIGTKNLRDNAWHHVVAYYVAGSYPEYYIDGVADPLTETGGTLGHYDFQATSAGAIGWYKRYGSYWIDGEMGVFTVYGPNHFGSAAPSRASLTAQYRMERDRYGAGTAVPVKWYPLHADSYDESATGTVRRYMQTRVQSGAESCPQVGNRLYMTPDAPGATDYPLRWDGLVKQRGYVVGTTGGGDPYFSLCSFSEVSEYMHAIAQANQYWCDNLIGDVPEDSPVLPGDTIYVKDHSVGTNGQWQLNGHVISKVKEGAYGNDVYVHGAGFSTTLKGEGPLSNACEYCIVRTHRVGVLGLTDTTPSATASPTGSMATGTYNYLCRLGNSQIGAWGDASNPSADAVLSGTGQIHVRPHIPAQPTDRGVDRLQIYRSKNSGAYYLGTTVNLVQWIGGSAVRANIAGTYTDTGWTNGALLPSDAYAHARPSRLRNMRYYNSRLYGAGVGTGANKLHFSSLGEVDYWPDVQWDYANTSSGTTYGGNVPVGANSNEKVTAILPEVGSFDTSGVQGSNLLVFTRDKAVRWYGWDWSDFRMESAFREGCSSPRAAVNAGGLIIWCNGSRILSMPAGSSVPQAISNQIFPIDIQHQMTADDRLAALDTWNAIYHGGKYFLSGSLSSETPDTVWIYDPSTNTWTSYPAGFHDFLAWLKPGDEQGIVLTGSGATLRSHAGVNWGELYSLFSQSRTDHDMTWRSGALPLSESELDFTRWKQLRKVTMCWLKPLTTDVPLTVKLYAEGNTTTAAQTVTATLTHVDTATHERQQVVIAPNQVDAKFIQLEASIATASTGVRLDWVALDYAIHEQS